MNNTGSRREAGREADNDPSRRINLRFDERMFRKLKSKAAREDTSFQELGTAWFQEWLAGRRERALPLEFTHLTSEEEFVLRAVLEFLRDPKIDRDDPGTIKPSLVRLGKLYQIRRRE